MTAFERKHMYPLIKGKSLTYFRYIDDIFLIWKGISDELEPICIVFLNAEINVYIK